MATEPRDGPSPIAASGVFVSPLLAGAAPIFRRVSIVRCGVSARRRPPVRARRGNPGGGRNGRKKANRQNPP